MAEAHTITPVVLAAGESSRMGFPKALLPLGEETFLIRILNTLRQAGLPEALVVLGAHARQILSASGGLPVRWLINENHPQGQLSSIKLALGHLELGACGCLLWPVDHPAVSAKLVADLVRLFLEREAALALPIHSGRRGHPAIISRALFAEIMETPSDEGMKSVVVHHQKEIALLPTGEDSTVRDIDTPEDYCRLTGETLAAALDRRRKLTIDDCFLD